MGVGTIWEAFWFPRFGDLARARGLQSAVQRTAEPDH